MDCSQDANNAATAIVAIAENLRGRSTWEMHHILTSAVAAVQESSGLARSLWTYQTDKGSRLLIQVAYHFRYAEREYVAYSPFNPVNHNGPPRDLTIAEYAEFATKFRRYTDGI